MDLKSQQEHSSATAAWSKEGEVLVGLRVLCFGGEISKCEISEGVQLLNDWLSECFGVTVSSMLFVFDRVELQLGAVVVLSCLDTFDLRDLQLY